MVDFLPVDKNPFPPNVEQVDHDPFTESHANLSRLQRWFLNVLDVAERYGGGATSMKLYNDIIGRGRTEPITEKDFTKDELAEIRSLVQSHSIKNNLTSGHIDYRDYPNRENRSKAGWEITNSLGGFNYKLDTAGNINVTDRYDFNASKGVPGEDGPFLQAISAIMLPGAFASQIGRKVLPDTSGRGVPVSINIPMESTVDINSPEHSLGKF